MDFDEDFCGISKGRSDWIGLYEGKGMGVDERWNGNGLEVRNSKKEEMRETRSPIINQS